MEFSRLIQFSEHNIALLLCDYLNSVGVSAKVEAESGGYLVLCESDGYPQAQLICEEFIKQPYHPKYQQAAWHNNQVTQVRSHGGSKANSFIHQFVHHAGIITLAVFVVCWLVYLASALVGAREVFSWLSFYQVFSIDAVLAEPHRLIGPALFHFSLLHIAFNTMWWWQLGGQIEQVLGKSTLVKLFLCSAIVSNFGQFVVSGPNFGGLSGVVYALVGFVWWYGWLAPNKGLALSKNIVGFMLVWLLLGFIEVLPVAVANTAHLLGLLSGCGYAWLKAKS